MATNGISHDTPTLADNSSDGDGEQLIDPASVESPMTTPSQFEHVAEQIEHAIPAAVINDHKNLDFMALRDQTLANINFILALYKHGNRSGLSAPSIVIANGNGGVFAAAVRTSYDVTLERTHMETTFAGLVYATEYDALMQLFGVTKEAVRRAISLSNSERGFDDWGQLQMDWAATML